MMGRREGCDTRAADGTAPRRQVAPSAPGKPPSRPSPKNTSLEESCRDGHHSAPPRPRIPLALHAARTARQPGIRQAGALLHSEPTDGGLPCPDAGAALELIADSSFHNIPASSPMGAPFPRLGHVRLASHLEELGEQCSDQNPKNQRLITSPTRSMDCLTPAAPFASRGRWHAS